MIVVEDDENDEKVLVFCCKFIKNVVEVKLKNEWEKEKFGCMLGNLVKEE